MFTNKEKVSMINQTPIKENKVRRNKTHQEKVNNNEVVETNKEKSKEIRNYEEEFAIIVYNYVPKDINIKNKRNQLGRFQYEKRAFIKGLECVSGIINDRGEQYYGFMFVSYLSIVIQ